MGTNEGQTDHGADAGTTGRPGPDFEIDLETGEVWQGGKPVDLPPRPTKLLVLLARRPGRLVTREEIQEEIWGDAVIEIDTAINNAVREIRDALGDDATAPRFVETVPRRGYRFVGALADDDARGGSVEPDDDGPEPAAAGVDPPTSVGSVVGSPPWIWPAAVAALLLVLFYALPAIFERGEAPPTVSLVPTHVAVAGSAAETFAERLHPAVEESLRALEERGVRYLAWEGTIGYDRDAGAVVRDGEPLQVDLLIEMNATLEGDSLRVGVTLLGVEAATQLWHRAFIHPADDPAGLVVRVRDRVAEEVERLLVG